ncbi:GNAT family N-acetyltransferase [Dermatobacter hominis]|uniref:GNAT family N-acetyltransferase n=1 Tax=Dermatobacter hominis TaxID=2884263 RepID=UPI001D10E900|nr:GNAT family N-acetyltransferase [Dermatobacter hominis]UDY33925.1 GNAT family N-acetyltransferase [Dermatobacter hominis]
MTGGKSTRAELTVRRAMRADRPEVVALCRAALGWRAGGLDEAFFSWKHDENPAGASPMWIAEDDGRPVGVRVFLRWRFRRPDGTPLRAVRAVDTATHPDAQGRGVFTRLTLGALPELRDDGVGAVFNTPNDQSRPGYLKMGWNVVGRVPVAVRPVGAGSLPRLAGARTAADKWSEEVDVGVPAIEAFADDDEVDLLLRRCVPRGLATDRDAAHLRWRYRFGPLHYRVLPVGDRLSDGCCVVRFRRRGDALEATVAETLLPDPRTGTAPLLAAARAAGADYLIAARGPSTPRSFVPVPRLGPVLTWRPVARAGTPRLRDLGLALGDVELF